MTNGIVLQDQLRRALRNLTIATVVLYLALAGVGLFGFIQASHSRTDLERVALSTNTALCALRHDLELRVASSLQFLEENPDGVPGISAATIRQSIANQRSTIEALSGLDCG